MEPKLSLKQQILVALAESPASAYTLATRFGTTQNSIRRRMTDLKRAGQVTVIDRVNIGDTNAKENLWAIAQAA